MKALVLRTSNKDGRSYGGFQWPMTIGATVTATDWKKRDECGNGLHGWLYGQGDHSCSSFLNNDSLWWVIEIESEQAIALGGKVKFPSGIVRFFGGRKEATDFLHEHEPKSHNVAVIGAVRADLRDGALLQVGALGSAIGGDGATLTGGYGATLTGGDRATLTGGDGATLTGGYRATLTGGHRATLTGGDGATLTGGARATLTGGDCATLTGGDGATLTGGDGATLTGGYGATLTGGDGATLLIKWYDGSRHRNSFAEVGENGIKANTPYHLNAKGEFVEGKAP